MLSKSTFPTDYLFAQNSNINDPFVLPNWGFAIFCLRCSLIVTFLVWFVGVPCLRYYYYDNSIRKSTNDESIHHNSTTATTGKRNKGIRKKSGANGGKKKYDRYHSLRRIVSPIFLCSLCTFGFATTTLLIIIFASPYNTCTSRRIFQLPILTDLECQRLIDMALTTAQRNVDLLSNKRGSNHQLSKEERNVLYSEPIGWQKVRHQDKPTTDLNIMTDPFTLEDQVWFQQNITNQRLMPIISRIYGIPIRSIQIYDMFIVRYDADNVTSSTSLRRNKLEKHTDGSDISFSIFLNSNFSGGGTQFWNRHTQKPFALLQPPYRNVSADGHMSIFSGRIEHEGYPISQGQRFIIVGFLVVDRYDHKGISTGVSYWATWFNSNWAVVRISALYAAYEWKSLYWRQVAYDFIKFTNQFMDRHMPHAVTPNFIQPNELPELIRVLDRSFQRISFENSTKLANTARWMGGRDEL
jgi:hypothetical protein